jgi:uncharacterized membrane protein
MEAGAAPARRFPYSAGVLFGLGLGGFFDGIVFHQLLQWHHMLTSDGYPPDSLHNVQVNVFWDGVFHASTYIFAVAGLILLWRAAHRRHLWWSGRLLTGTLLIGFGAFNLVEGLVDHQILAFITSTRRCRARRGSIGTWDSLPGARSCSWQGAIVVRRGRAVTAGS